MVLYQMQSHVGVLLKPHLEDAWTRKRTVRERMVTQGAEGQCCHAGQELRARSPGQELAQGRSSGQETQDRSSGQEPQGRTPLGRSSGPELRAGSQGRCPVPGAIQEDLTPPGGPRPM